MLADIISGVEDGHVEVGQEDPDPCYPMFGGGPDHNRTFDGILEDDFDYEVDRRLQIRDDTCRITKRVIP